MTGRGRRVSLGMLLAVNVAVWSLVIAGGASAQGAAAPDRGARPTHPDLRGAVPDVAPAASALNAAQSARLVRNFNGVSSLDSAVTNFGAEFEPPDQGLCIGNGLVLEPVNSAFRVFRQGGRSIAGPTNVNAIFGDGFKQFTSDPRCQYDPATHTWFASILFLNDTFTASRLEIAVRHAADPRGTWTHFRINTTDAGGHGCPCFGDQPMLGIDGQNIYVSTNEFSINGAQFNGAQLYVIDKRQLVDGDASPTFVHIGPLRIGHHKAASVQPAITIGSSRAEYLMSSLDPKGAGDNRIGVWALTNRVLGSHPDPHLQRIIIPSQGYSTPPATPQMGSKSLIDSGDDRMQQVQAIGGRLWGELGTALRTGGGKPVAAAAWFDVAPSLDRDRLSATINRQGYVVSPGNGVLYPAIAGDRSGNAAMGFSVSGPGMFPSAGYATLSSGGSNFGPPTIASRGRGPSSGSRRGGATTPGRCSTRPPHTVSGWPTSTSRPGRARPSTATRTGGRASTRCGCPARSHGISSALETSGMIGNEGLRVDRRAAVAALRLPARKLRGMLLGAILVGDARQQVRDAVEPGAPLVVGLDHEPGRLLGVGVREHRRPWPVSTRPSARATRGPSGSSFQRLVGSSIRSWKRPLLLVARPRTST